MASLYRTYRPHSFDDLVDQQVAKQALQNSVASGTVSHAYLFCGPRGTGKTSTARILARALVCDSPAKGNPCGACAICEESAQQQLIDIVEIDAASNRGIDEIRALREKISFAPTRAKKKVYIIDEVHMLTKDAFNALLKTLEEPPAHAHFILATTEIHKVLDTIISRCQRYDFRRITTAGIVGRLEYIVAQEGFSFVRPSLELTAEAANGGLRDAIRSLEQLHQTGTTDEAHVRQFLGMAGSLRIRELVDHLLAKELSQGLQVVQELYAQGVHMRELAKETVLEIRERMITDIAADRMTLVRQYMHMIEAFEHAKVQLAKTLVEQLPLEIACVRACESMLPAPAAVAPTATPVVSTPPAAAPSPAPVVKKSTPISTPKASPRPEKTPVTEAMPSSPKPSLLDDVLALPADEASPTAPVAVAEEDVMGDCSLERIQQDWKSFCNAISKSSVKFCLKEGRPVRLQGRTLLVRFPTQFSMDKVLETANRDVVHGALSTFFKVDFELAGEVAGTDEVPLPSSPTPSAPAASADEVLSVFEGSEFL